MIAIVKTMITRSTVSHSGTRFTLARDQGDRLAFCVVNVESRIDDLLEFLSGVSLVRGPDCV
jgi:hypothetical protein